MGVADSVSATIAAAGDHAARRFLEFFAASIRNKNTLLPGRHGLLSPGSMPPASGRWSISSRSTSPPI
jgi:hypothetical protein